MRRIALGLGATAVVVIVAFIVLRQAGSSTESSSATPTPASSGKLVAHGVVQPVSQARVGTLGGGVLLGVSVAIGESVESQRPVARVRGQSDVEVLTAPFAGTITGVLAHTGDTLLPGAGVLTVADLSHLQVETTDVDEFMIGHLHTGDSVMLEIEALNRRELTGKVQTVSLQPQTTPGGDQHYPVTIDTGGTQPDLRPGMSVRITLSN